MLKYIKSSVVANRLYLVQKVKSVFDLFIILKQFGLLPTNLRIIPITVRSFRPHTHRRVSGNKASGPRKIFVVPRVLQITDNNAFTGRGMYKLVVL